MNDIYATIRAPPRNIFKTETKRKLNKQKLKGDSQNIFPMHVSPHITFGCFLRFRLKCAKQSCEN